MALQPKLAAVPGRAAANAFGVSRPDALATMQRAQQAVAEAADEELGELFPRAVRKTDIIYATNQLAVMVDTGITLSAALESLCQTEPNPTWKVVLEDLKAQVLAGGDFSTALAAHPRHFDKTYVSLIKASEQTGTLAEMLDTVANYLRAQMETKAKVRAALAYPTVMAVLACGVTIFLLTYILPKFTPLFERKGVALPKATQVLMVASHALMGYWWAWLLGLAAVVIGYLIAKKTEPGRKVIDWVFIHLPIVGPMMRKVILSRSIKTLGTMVRSGVSMLDAIKLTGEVSGNWHYENVWKHVLDQVTQGEPIHKPLVGNPLFPSTLVQMIAAGEETGKLDDVLHKVSAYFDREVETSLKATTSLIEPIMITVMGVVVGGIALGLLLPIFSLSRPG